MAIFFPSSLEQAACQHMLQTITIVQAVDIVALLKLVVLFIGSKTL
jgi:hypothetical protein